MHQKISNIPLQMPSPIFPSSSFSSLLLCSISNLFFFFNNVRCTLFFNIDLNCHGDFQGSQKKIPFIPISVHYFLRSLPFSLFFFIIIHTIYALGGEKKVRLEKDFNLIWNFYHAPWGILYILIVHFRSGFSFSCTILTHTHKQTFFLAGFPFNIINIFIIDLCLRTTPKERKIFLFITSSIIIFDGKHTHTHTLKCTQRNVEEMLFFR